MPEVSLSELELSILAWPLSDQPQPAPAAVTLSPGGPTDRFRQEIDISLLQRAVAYLRQEIDQQQQALSSTRRKLPKGWYRQSNPTFDLEVLSDGLSGKVFLDLPKVWPDRHWLKHH